ncbi:MAG: flagellar basal-body MS-ring/collar protein FliF [Desulfobacterales bacterium]|jgi:flagellar M-ring protein FliF
MPFRQILSQLQNLFKSISLTKRIVLLTIAVGSVAGFVFLMNWAAKPEFHPLYSHLDANDAGVIIGRLKDEKIPYRLSANGSTILIPQELIYETRMNLASEGLPQGGSTGFELFDNTKLGMTEFAQNVNYQRALQGELVRTINGFEEVESSRVHIVLPEKSLFIKDEESASASVVLKLKHGKFLSQQQVQGIVHLVSSSVSRLMPENVTVVDNSGRMLTGRNDPAGLSALSSDQLDHQLKVERKLETRVLSMLEKALGANRAIVRVSCALNFKQHEMTEERFFPENQVVRSEQTYNETAKESDPIPEGIPGIQSNLPETSAALNKTTEEEDTTFAKQDRTVNYEIGKLTSRTLEPVGGIDRISVAVMVDGTYQSTVTEDGETQTSYVPRTPAELTQIENLVKRAVNFDAQRGDQVEVVNIPFESSQMVQPETDSAILRWLDHIKPYKPYFKYAFLSLFLCLTFLFIVKPLIKWLTGSAADDAGILQQLPKTVGELENEADPKLLAFKDQISQLITQDSEASLGVMRDWLKEESNVDGVQGTHE